MAESAVNSLCTKIAANLTDLIERLLNAMLPVRDNLAAMWSTLGDRQRLDRCKPQTRASSRSETYRVRYVVKYVAG